MIIFLRDHSVGEGEDLETFTKGQKVERPTPESEMHFVRRGHAAFVDVKTGALTDHEGNPIEMPEDLELVSNDRDARTARSPARALAGTGKKAAPKAKAGKAEIAAPAKAASKGGKRAAKAKVAKASPEQQLPLVDGLDALSDDALLEKAVELGVEGGDREALLAAIRAKLAEAPQA